MQCDGTEIQRFAREHSGNAAAVAGRSRWNGQAHPVGFTRGRRVCSLDSLCECRKSVAYQIPRETKGSRNSFGTRSWSLACDSAAADGVDCAFFDRWRCGFANRLLGNSRISGSITSEPVERNAIPEVVAYRWKHPRIFVRSLFTDWTRIWTRSGASVFTFGSQ